MPASLETRVLHVPTDTSLPLASSVRQINALQFLRAAAVTTVVWCHAGQVLDFTASHRLPDFGVIGVDIFFVISGFILSLTVLKDRKEPGPRPMLDFLKRRAIRIYPIYWFVAAVTLVRIRLSHPFEYNYVTPFFLLPSFHFPEQVLIVDFSWTLDFEVFFYFVLGLILLFTIKRAVPTMILVLAAAIAIGATLGIRHPFTIIFANPILLEFVFGAIIAILYSRFGRRPVMGIALTAAGTAGMLVLLALHLPTVANGAQMILADDGVFARVATWGVSSALIVSGMIFWSPSMKGPSAEPGSSSATPRTLPTSLLRSSSSTLFASTSS